MKKFLCTLLALIMIISASAVTTYAAVKTPDAGVQNTFSVGFTTRRYSDTKAAGSADVNFTKKADSYTVIIILQRKKDNNWITAVDISNNTHRYYGTKDSSVLTYDEWTVKKGDIYRIKCISTDRYDGIEYTRTCYSDPF